MLELISVALDGQVDSIFQADKLKILERRIESDACYEISNILEWIEYNLICRSAVWSNIQNIEILH